MGLSTAPTLGKHGVVKNDDDLRVPAGRLVGPVENTDDDSSTRDRVARSILTHGPSTAAALGERLSLTPAAIRRHLGVLLEQGQVVGSEQRVYGTRGRGRPAKVFALTDAGRTHFYQAYDELAIAALRQLASAAGPDALTRLAEGRVAAVEQNYHRIRAGRPEATPLEALTEALNADGYVASVKPASTGEQLCQHHCPVAHVAEEFPQLCEIETKVFGRLLGQNVQRLATIAHGHGVCTTNVPDLDKVRPVQGTGQPIDHKEN